MSGAWIPCGVGKSDLRRALAIFVQDDWKLEHTEGYERPNGDIDIIRTYWTQPDGKLRRITWNALSGKISMTLSKSLPETARPFIRPTNSKEG